MEVEIVIDHRYRKKNALSLYNEERLFGKTFYGVVMVKMDEEGILFKTYKGTSTLLLKAKNAWWKKGNLYLSFDQEEIDKFKEKFIFLKKEVHSEQEFIDDIKNTLEIMTGIKFTLDTHGIVKKSKGKNMDRVFVGYSILDLGEKADLVMTTIRKMYRKGEIERDLALKAFRIGMEKSA